ncbi:MAG: peptide-methionine (S)-S-oxide reductase, partial [Cyanobacteria bacterium J06648_11]
KNPRRVQTGQPNSASQTAGIGRRQGPDRGEQYRSVIFYHSPDQKALAERSLRERDRSGEYETAIVTQICPASAYYLATEEHQQYFAKKAQPQPM